MGVGQKRAWHVAWSLVRDRMDSLVLVPPRALQVCEFPGAGALDARVGDDIVAGSGSLLNELRPTPPLDEVARA